MNRDPGNREWPSSAPQQNVPGGPRKTAGSGSAGGDGVRDWQRNTWYGPAASPNVNPFDEPEDAPELRESRSETVNDHTGVFWDAGPEAPDPYFDGSQPVPVVSGSGKKAPRKEETGRPRRKYAGKVFLGFLLVLGITLLVLRFAVFTVRNITVIGNETVPAEEILSASGIHRGDSILTLNEAEVERRIESDYRLIFRYMEKKLPSDVTVSIKEREACCWLTYGGILYTMDKNGMVMFETEDLTIRPALVEVKGLNIRSGCMVGQSLVLTTDEQALLFRNLFLEMKVLGCTQLILEADVSNYLSVLLVTRDDFTVSLGDMNNLHAKLRSMLLVREALLADGIHGGTINVVNPETPYFSPGSSS